MDEAVTAGLHDTFHFSILQITFIHLQCNILLVRSNYLPVPLIATCDVGLALLLLLIWSRMVVQLEMLLIVLLEDQ